MTGDLCREKIFPDMKFESSCKDRVYLFFCLDVESTYCPEIENLLTYSEKKKARVNFISLNLNTPM